MSESAGPARFGRVDSDGTVYVVSSAGERRVGQVPDTDPAEALTFFVRRYEALETEVNLLSKRIESGTVSPEEARKAVNGLRTSITEANAVGDLERLTARLDGLAPQLAAAQEARKAQRVQQNEETKASKEAMVDQAEKLAAGNDWRGGVNKFRALLDDWKALPRIDRATDDELWHRFSSARTTYTRRRKAQFANENERRDAARKAKEAIIGRSREIAGSTDWAGTAAEFRQLMTQWKAAGGAAREVDDTLWAEFRGLQDQFFDARSAAFSAEDDEFSENLTAKQGLLDQAEAAILPVNDVKAAREAFRGFLAQYNQYGKVPRDSIRPLENRLRAMENAIKTAEDDEWRRTDPEARKRAADTVEMFSAQIEKLAKQADDAEARGDSKKAQKTRESIKTYTEWLDQANKALDEFSGH
ncbi:DUF349 domain-containing protein [Brooklawnia sp.]|uniref:DUF349 domain-containing protein n=1 Tax=Brooklawnia sp. TaxID=2699740 RepID=UPI00311E9570